MAQPVTLKWQFVAPLLDSRTQLNSDVTLLRRSTQDSPCYSYQLGVSLRRSTQDWPIQPPLLRPFPDPLVLSLPCRFLVLSYFSIYVRNLTLLSWSSHFVVCLFTSYQRSFSRTSHAFFGLFTLTQLFCILLQGQTMLSSYNAVVFWVPPFCGTSL